MSKGILQVHPPICDCPGCRISSPVNRGRLAEKRSIPLPPSRVPKKELGPLLSPSEDSQDSDRSNGQQPQVKQEEDLHISIMKRRIHTHWDLNISFRETSCRYHLWAPLFVAAHIPSASNSSSQRRKQGLPQHRDSHFPDREISHPPPLLSPQNAPHIALGPHLRPPFLGVPSALCQTPGYGFLQPAQAEMFARQQEMLRKQNLARLEMSAELIRQKELENLHRQRLLAADPLSLHPGLPPDHPALRSVHDVPEGQALRDEKIFRLQAACCPCGILMIYVPFSSPPSHNPGTMGGLFLDGEESPALEDISKWTVEDVCSFVSSLSGCTEYTQVFREQAIDGETLPLLTEEHLLNNMGLKLGPALKIRSQVGNSPLPAQVTQLELSLGCPERCFVEYNLLSNNSVAILFEECSICP
uniref:Sterile alpha motif domain containing 11 n=1 Tax=Serinus canaria TaxID=9135 RepID=A0A8C9NRE6_SERCA